ncbi:RIB43A-domain-containing protein, partial [Pelagophyceae sp. CCMP2097]
RRRSQQRVSRMLDAKQRTIGVDRAFLDMQIAEKADRRESEAAEARAYVDYEERLRDVVWARECAEMEEAHNLGEELKQDWGKAESARRVRDAAARVNRPCDPEQCGPSAVQRLVGEDADFETRQKSHDQQVQSWLRQQVSEKEARSAEDRAEEMRYAAYEDAVSQQRHELEMDDVDRRRATQQRLSQENRFMAAEAAAKRGADDALVAAVESAEVRKRLNDPALNETTDVGRSVASAYRYRPDHFKGFARGRVDLLLRDNDRLVGEKQRHAADASAVEAAFASSQREMLALAQDEEAAYAAAERRAMLALQQNHVDQREAERQRKIKSKQDSFGYIQPGYMDGFGRSDR